jgi:hypothetical protein
VNEKMSEKIFVDNPQSRVQSVYIPKGKNKVENLVFKPGMNEISKIDWGIALRNKIFQNKVKLGYLREITDIETKELEDGTKKVKITAALISQTFDVELLEKWLRSGDVATKDRAKVKAQIKRMTAPKEEDTQKPSNEMDELLGDFE